MAFRFVLATWMTAIAMMSDAQAATQPNVVVTLKPVHSLVSQLMDGIGVPTLIVDGSASPHTFTLKPSAARAIQNADIFIRVSEHVEPFTRKVVEALPKTVSVITLADVPGMTVLDQRSGGTFEPHHHEHAAGELDDDHDDDASPSNAAKDGHLWLDPENAKVIVTAVQKALAERYPEASERLTANAAALTAKIDALNTEIADILKSHPSRPFIIFHDATQYFERRFGLIAAGSITVSPDVQPSAKRLTEVRQKILGLGSVCVFAEPGFQPNLVAAVTEGTTARAGTLDAEALTLSPGPALYFEMMRALAHNIESCFKSES